MWKLVESVLVCANFGKFLDAKCGNLLECILVCTKFGNCMNYQNKVAKNCNIYDGEKMPFSAAEVATYTTPVMASPEVASCDTFCNRAESLN